MILITQGQANTVVVTLLEKETLSSPNYLFRFINQVTLKENTCVASDISLYTYRYNQFSITESSSQDRENGTLTLDRAGDWTYMIYEQASATNLSKNNTGGLLETGKCRVIGTAPSYVKHEPTDNTYTAYES